MAEIPTPEGCGRRLLEVYSERKIRPGEMIQDNYLQSHFVDTESKRADDLSKGLNWCCESGFLEQRQRGMWHLTEAGFAEIDSIG